MRSYGDKFLLELRDADPNRLGVQLGRICVDANLPAMHVSKVLEVSKTTVYAWFRGQYIREENRRRVCTVQPVSTEMVEPTIGLQSRSANWINVLKGYKRAS
jgi:hypothetical protein